MNRLKLDWDLSNYKDRMYFVKVYLGEVKDEEYGKEYEESEFPFKYKPTNEELEKIANYVLYGKDEETGKSVVDEGKVVIEGRHSPWKKKTDKSLEGMKEEAAITGAPIESQNGMMVGRTGKRNEVKVYKAAKMALDREEVKRELEELGEEGEFLLQQYEYLWKDIDLMEYSVTDWMIQFGGRKKEIRKELVERLSEEEREYIHEANKEVGRNKLAKRRKMLVDMRQQQYTMRDSYAPVRMSGKTPEVTGWNNSSEELCVEPLGMKMSGKIGEVLFYEEIDERHFEKEGRNVVEEYLKNRKEEKGRMIGEFDFRDIDSIALFLYAREDVAANDMEDFEEREVMEQFVETLEYYINMADLNEVQRRIIELKVKGYSNPMIMKEVNKEFEKGYSSNYISTIFRNQCCKEIANAAKLHFETIKGVLKGKEEFKECNTCGKMLLRSSENFVKKSRSKDGFTGRCKRCDRKVREGKKEK